MSDVAAIILAAGRGTRFGARQSKLTASCCGAPILGHVAAKALASGALPVILVTGHDSEFVERAVDGLALTIVHNTDYEQGLSTSLRAGLAALEDDISGTLVMLGDMPLVTVETLSRLIAAHSQASADCAAIIPRYKGLRGNPALLRRSMFCDVTRLVGDKGAGQLFAGPAPVEFLDVDDPGVITDIDTPEDLARLGRP